MFQAIVHEIEIREYTVDHFYLYGYLIYYILHVSGFYGHHEVDISNHKIL
jgi:hypothetical protein